MNGAFCIEAAAERIQFCLHQNFKETTYHSLEVAVRSADLTPSDSVWALRRQLFSSSASLYWLAMRTNSKLIVVTFDVVLKQISLIFAPEHKLKKVRLMRLWSCCRPSYVFNLSASLQN